MFCVITGMEVAFLWHRNVCMYLNYGFSKQTWEVLVIIVDVIKYINGGTKTRPWSLSVKKVSYISQSIVWQWWIWMVPYYRFTFPYLSFSLRIYPLHFQAGGRKRPPNLGFFLVVLVPFYVIVFFVILKRGYLCSDSRSLLYIFVAISAVSLFLFSQY